MENLNEIVLKKYLKVPFVFFENTASTFDTDADLVIAAEQSRGRGRLGREFLSQRGGIYFTLRTPLYPKLTISACAGVMRTLEKHGFSPSVKWVNDVYLDGKKVCGIYAKACGDRAAIGVGINYTQLDFGQYSDRAGGLYPDSDGINEFAAEVITSVADAVRSDNIEYYRARLLGTGGEITVDGERVIFVGVDDEGRLLYERDGKLNVLSGGEIQL